ncbi:MAG TPA: TrkH family potassium uptake protein [Phycisphaerae bacterium]|nr:TrkH family potassium uptake protein [Phycisphaerae bacterium]
MRERQYLGQRYAAMLASVGLILLLASGLALTPLLVLFSHPEEAAHAGAFGWCAGCMALAGLALWGVFRSPARVTLSVQEGGVIVVLSWIVVILFSAWPFTSILGISFSNAVFESVSGWTTTGLSVVDVTKAGPMILLWRSVIQLAGGAGLAIIMMSAIVGPVGVGISSAEGRSDQLVPHVRQSARLVLVIYGCYAAAGTLAYWLAGMTPFDAVNQAFAAVSTGGFSTRAESIGYWDSVTVEAVTLALMVLGNLSFVTAWYLWRGHLRAVARNGEVRVQVVLIPLAAAAAVLLTCRGLYPELSKAIRVGVFETVSALTTTGFSTVSYGAWNSAGIAVLVGLMLIGGGTCSTAGGIKQIRIYVLWRQLVWEIRSQLLPQTAVVARPLWEGDTRVFLDDARVRQLAVFVFLFVVSYLLGVLVLCACGFGLSDALFEFASSIATVGLSVGVTSADMPRVALWAEIIAMFFGRLEFIVVIASVLKMTRDLRVLWLPGRTR